MIEQADGRRDRAEDDPGCRRYRRRLLDTGDMDAVTTFQALKPAISAHSRDLAQRIGRLIDDFEFEDAARLVGGLRLPPE